MGNQLIQDGDVSIINGQEFECTGVTYQEFDGVRKNFSYTFRLKAEVDAEREAEAKHQEELRLAEEAGETGEVPTVDQLTNQAPEEEETQHVR